MKTLNLTFKGSLNKTHTLKLRYANNNLDAKTVKAAMEQISQANLFEKGGEALYLTPVSAKYVTTTEDLLFDEEEGIAA